MQDINSIQSQRLSTEQKLTPKQILSLNILQDNIYDIQQKITHELEFNPTLELISPALQDKSLHIEYDKEVNKHEEQNLIASNIAKDESLAVEFARDAISSNQDFLVNQTNHITTFKTFLQEQIPIETSQENKELLIILIDAINEYGLLEQQELNLIQQEQQVSSSKITKILKIIQSMEPRGVAARTLQESLLLQIEDTSSFEYKIIKNHLDLLEQNKLPLIAKKLKISLTKLKLHIENIQQLSPYPASSIQGEKENEVIIELICTKNDDDTLKVKLAKDILPKIRLSTKYYNLLKDKNTPKETKEYLKNKILASNNLMQALDFRKKTLLRIAEKIILIQNDFLLNKQIALSPLLLKQVSLDLNIHESTLSKAINNKYIKTPRGIFPLRFFFSLKSNTKEDVSLHFIYKKLQDIIQNEDAKSPLSDQKISTKFYEQGYNISRRTISKYREKLNIPTSSKRKKH